jgi:two-component system CheB/CheR fusion protein
MKPNTRTTAGSQEAALQRPPPRPYDVPIAGIGTSAGGLEALEAFFTNMPSDSGMAFVLVQHLDPTHKSILTDLVKPYTKMRVRQVEADMRVEPNHVYIIPPNCDMALAHGTLQLIEPTVPRGLRLPIDFFFRSLAEEQHGQAICIVLSGTGSDGTLGLKAVKEHGGMVMVQDPQTAKYDGMPRSAIATGLVDFVLPTVEMGKQLIAYVRQTLDTRGERRPPPVAQTRNDLQKLFHLLRGHTGHDFSEYRHSTVMRRIERRMTINQLGGLSDYISYLQQNPREVEALFKELLIRVSNFFRDPEAFATLEKKVIPRLLKHKNVAQTVRAWVPGCATGEEAYSVAMLFQEQMEVLNRRHEIQIFGTDIDSEAIDAARTATYPENIAADMPAERLHRHFIKQPSGYQVAKGIREMLVFAEQDVLKDPPFSRLDLISCRNLLIYLEDDLQKRLLPLFYYALKGGGYLFLGSAESIGEATALFSVVSRKWKIFQCKGTALIHTPGMQAPAPLFPPQVTTAGGGKEPKPLRRPTPKETTERLLLKHHAPACVLVSDQGDCLHFHGDTGSYLQPPSGAPHWNVVGMAREGLRLTLSSAIRKVATSKQTLRYENLAVKVNGGDQRINLAVQPVPEQLGPPGALLILFQPLAPRPSVRHAQAAQPSEQGDRRIVELDQELRATKEYLQTTIEELKTANEELQSANEELQSTNEELQTSKEELQSTNEELVTVNTEHKKNLERLAKAHNDIQNLLTSTDIGAIFLDMDLRIRQFTAAATRIVNLRETDIGRPITEIASTLNYDQLVPDIHEVLVNLVPREFEIQAKNKLWYVVRIRPYRTAENVIEGSVVTFVDINALKKVEEQLRLLTAAVEQSPNSILITDTAGTIEYVNPYFTKVTGYTGEEAIGKRPTLLKSNQHPQALYQELWQTISAGQVWRGELRNRKKDGTLYDDDVVISPIKNDRGIISRFLSIQTDITERKRIEDKARQQREALSHMARVSTMGEMATGLAHELNQPLTALVTYTEGIAHQVQSGKTLDAASLAALGKTAALAKRAAGILRGIREFLTKHESVRQRIDINEVVRRAVELTTAEARKEGTSVTLDLQSDLPTLQGNFIQLQQVVVNLICNAIEAMEEVARHERTLMVRTFMNDHREIEVVVQDTGPGLRADMAAHMFDAFVTTKSKGMGMGLAICRTVVEAHGGRIFVSSPPGRGAAIRMTVPIGNFDNEPSE